MHHTTNVTYLQNRKMKLAEFLLTEIDISSDLRKTREQPPGDAVGSTRRQGCEIYRNIQAEVLTAS
jgi:hypothetical protein